MVRSEDEDQVHVVRFVCRSDETAVNDDGLGEPALTRLGEKPLQLLKLARATVARLEKTEAGAEFVESAFVQAWRQKPFRREVRDRHAGIMKSVARCTRSS